MMIIKKMKIVDIKAMINDSKLIKTNTYLLIGSGYAFSHLMASFFVKNSTPLLEDKYWDRSRKVTTDDFFTVTNGILKIFYQREQNAQFVSKFVILGTGIWTIAWKFILLPSISLSYKNHQLNSVIAPYLEVMVQKSKLRKQYKKYSRSAKIYIVANSIAAISILCCIGFTFVNNPRATLISLIASFWGYCISNDCDLEKNKAALLAALDEIPFDL